MELNAFIYLEFIRQVMSDMSGTTEKLSHGTPGFYVQNKMLARIWENGEVLVVRTDDRDKWIQNDPEVYFVTDHYRNYPTVLINLSKVEPDELKHLLREAWLNRASKRLLKQYEGK